MSHPILCQLDALQRQVPGPDASPAEMAGWYLAKGELLAHIATEGGPNAGEHMESSAAAYAHAAALMKGATA